jgi:putative tryptophan/tyrosine transport system substrate-binding protein
VSRLTEIAVRLNVVGIIATIAFCILAVSLADGPQPRPKVPRIGWLASGFPPSEAARQQSPFWQRLHELGWVEGQNIAVEGRYAEAHYDRLPALATELLQLGVDVIVAGDSRAIPAAKQATDTIPIVMTVSGDPVRSGYVASLAQPGGNITGLANVSPELAGKRLEFLKEVVPGMERLAILGELAHGDWQEIALAAQVLGVQLQALKVQRPDEFEQVFDAAMRERADALIVLPSLLTNRYGRRIVTLAAQSRLPTMYAIKESVKVGGLMAYGPSIPDLYWRAAYYSRGSLPTQQEITGLVDLGFVVGVDDRGGVKLLDYRRAWHCISPT